MTMELRYNVFLSHSAKDKVVVRPLAERLRARPGVVDKRSREDGLNVWFDEWVVAQGEGNFSIQLFLRAVDRLHEAWFKASHVMSGVRFLSPGEEKKPPLMQEIWLPKKSCNRGRTECSKAIEPVMTAVQANKELAELSYGFGYRSPRFVEFGPPFDKYFTAGWQYLNVLHPSGKALAECIKAIAERRSLGGLTDRDLGTLGDALQPLFGHESRPPLQDYLSGKAIEEKCEQMRRLFDLLSEMEIFELSTEMSWASEALNVPFVVKAGELGAPIQSLREVGLC